MAVKFSISFYIFSKSLLVFQATNSVVDNKPNINIQLESEMEKFYADLDNEGTKNTLATVENKFPVNCEENQQTLKNSTHLQIDDLNDEFLDSIQNCEDISGTKCQAPVSNDWSGTSFHNAMIMSIDESTNDDDVTVRVLFLNPTSEQMKICPYLLDAKCRYSKTK